jgi:hypothetical protein
MPRSYIGKETFRASETMREGRGIKENIAKYVQLVLDTWRDNPGDGSKMPASRARNPLKPAVENYSLWTVDIT